MKVLVTGANGFLGRAVVRELLDRGHSVRAMVRETGQPSNLSRTPGGDLEIFYADLCVSDNLVAAFEGVDSLIHLAASTTGREPRQFESTLIGTRRLLEAMTRSSTRQIVLASSLAVYDWSACEGEVTETAPIDVDVTTRDPYASMKIVQERDTRRMSDQHAWRLTVIRPGFIWGQGNKTAGALSHRIGPVHVVIGPTTRIPLTHVENCASAFVAATEKNSASGGQTFNVIDGHDVSTWDYVGASLRQAGRRDWRLPIPYRLGMALVKIVDWSNRVLLRNNLSFLRVLTPRRFEARFKPLKFSNESLRTSLGWFPRHSFKECLELTYPARGRRTGVGG